MPDLNTWQWVNTAQVWLHPVRRAIVWQDILSGKWLGCWALADTYKDAHPQERPEFGMRRIAPKPTAEEAREAVLEAMQHVDRQRNAA